MATKLKNMKLKSVDLVKAGANQEAHIRLHKSAESGTTSQEASETPTEAEKNIFKRFLGWLHESLTDFDYEPENPITKGDLPEVDDTANIYKSAIAESVHSILADDSLSAEEKNDMIKKSLDQYHEKMMELVKADFLEDDDDEEDDEDAPTNETGDQGQLLDPDDDDTPEPDYDEIEEVEDSVKKK